MDPRGARLAGRPRPRDWLRSFGGSSCAALIALCLIACSKEEPNDMANAAVGTGGTASATAGSGGAAAAAGASGTSSPPMAGTSAAASAGRGGTPSLAAAGTGGTTTAGSGGMPAPPVAGAAGAAPPAGDTCTRERLKATVDAYFTALSAKDPSSLSLAPDARFTENGEELELGEGLWKEAGAVAFKHSAFDTESCSSVTEAVVAAGSTDIPFGLRLKLVGQQISEIESIAVRSGDYFVASNTRAISTTASEDWEALLEPADRGTREALVKLVDDYFNYFPAGACGFADDCRRLENGFSPGNCSLGLSCSPSGTPRGGMAPRLHVIDVEAGIAVGFVMFAGSYTDFHMFKVRGGEVHGVHAILAEADGPGWE